MREENDPDRAADGCDFCAEAAAVVYCRADSARLCLSCDRHVHAANSVCSRHHRALLCDACRAAPAAFLCSSPPHRLLLCSNCDFDAHADSPHARRSLDPFSGCPSALDLASLFGVAGDVKSPPPPEEAADGGWPFAEEAADGGWPFAEEAWVWETAPVFSMEDLIVPTTSFHGFQATGIPPPPKNRDVTCGKQKEEILQQLRELIKSESQVNDDGRDLVKSGSCLIDEGGEVGVDVKVEPVAAPEEKLREGNLRSDFDLESSCVAVPTFEVNAPQWNHNDNCDVSGTVVFTYGQLTGSSSTVNASFLDGERDVYATANDAIGNDGVQGHPVRNENITLVPPKGVLELCPNRESVISRYKQKRKARRYDKLIRYESRKTRADSRIRIKGRFAKGSQIKDT